MQKYLLLALVSITVLTGCNQQQQQAAAPAAAQPTYRTTATIKDIMDSIVDPSSDYIWESVETVVSAKGIEEKMPRTDEEWKEVRRRAIALMEATNLLQMPGRHVAKPGEKADDPKVELGPEQIEELINKDRGAWYARAQALHDATSEVMKYIEAKDAPNMLNTSDKIDAACENCHLQYWYPNEKKPEAQASTKSGN
jgi:hypothetical protein